MVILCEKTNLTCDIFVREMTPRVKKNADQKAMVSIWLSVYKSRTFFFRATAPWHGAGGRGTDCNGSRETKQELWCTLQLSQSPADQKVCSNLLVLVFTTYGQKQRCSWQHHRRTSLSYEQRLQEIQELYYRPNKEWTTQPGWRRKEKQPVFIPTHHIPTFFQMRKVPFHYKPTR